MKRKTRKHLTVAAARTALDAWAHEHNLACAVRTNDPADAAHAAAQPGFVQWVARYVVATRPSGSALHQRTDARTAALVALIHRRAELWSETDALWHEDGTLNVTAVVWQLAADLAQGVQSKDLDAFKDPLNDYIADQKHKKNPVKNIGRSFERWLAKVSPTWPTRPPRDPAVERSRRKTASALDEAAAELAAWDASKTED